MDLDNAITIEYSYIDNKKSSIRVIFEDRTIDRVFTVLANTTTEDSAV